MSSSEERARRARLFGLDPSEIERLRATRTGIAALSAARPEPAPATTDGPDPAWLRRMGINAADFSKWQSEQLVEAKRRMARGEPLSTTQRALLASASAATSAAPTAQTIGRLSLGAAVAAVKAAIDRGEGRVGTARGISSSIGGK
jgi:hypothetical protein